MKRFLERFLGQGLKVEAIGTIEELAEEPADAWARSSGSGIPAKRLLDLVDAADADFIPVVKLVLEPREGLIGVLTRRVFVTDAVHDRVQHRQPAALRSALGL